MERKLPELIDFQQERIRTLHYTWIAFFITFYIWFNMAPLATTMLRDLGGDGGWLTPEHLKVLAICNVALTIPARIVVGALIDRYGPRRCFSWLLITMSVPALAFAFGNTFLQLLVARLVLSSIGAGFVIGIRMVAQWFPPKMIGRAEGFYAGWGNFGSAWAAMTLPWLALSAFGDHPHGWRYALAINAFVCLAYGIIYPRLVRDVPEGKAFLGVKKTQPLLCSSYFDLAQYLVWSAPLFAALGLLAWRAHDIKLGDGAETLVPEPLLYTIYGLLGLMFLGHCAKTLQVNLPRLKAGVAEGERFSFHSVAALNTTYFANFGAELAVISMLPAFFEGTFSVSPTQAGLVASSFAFVNLFARPLGGLISDSLRNRKLVMIAYMVGIAAGFGAMACITPSWPLYLAVGVTILCSVFVQGAEGATFAIIPMIHKPATGQIAGMAGAYGNVGAVVYLVVLSLVDNRTFFWVLCAGAVVSVVHCALFLTEPEGSFADEGEAAASDLSVSDSRLDAAGS